MDEAFHKLREIPEDGKHECCWFLRACGTTSTREGLMVLASLAIPTVDALFNFLFFSKAKLAAARDSFPPDESRRGAPEPGRRCTACGASGPQSVSGLRRASGTGPLYCHNRLESMV